MRLTKKLDLGAIIAGLSALVVVGAVVAGLIAVGGPGDARALRLDALMLRDMQSIATAAECVYTFKNKVPASTEEIRTGMAQRPSNMVGTCDQLYRRPRNEAAIAYSVENADHIRLCATFQRATPPEGQTAPIPYDSPVTDFPELQEPRNAAGRHCYVVHLQKVAT